MTDYEDAIYKLSTMSRRFITDTLPIPIVVSSIIDDFIVVELTRML